MEIEASNGNVIFPAGNALKYLHEYFPNPESIDLTVPCGYMPYTSRLGKIGSVSVNPNGDMMLCSFPIGNIYKDHVLSVIDNYDPYNNPVTQALMDGGAAELLRYDKGIVYKGIEVQSFILYEVTHSK